MGAEQDMVNSIKGKYSQIIVEENSSKAVNGQTKYCDLALCIDNKHYFLETKHYNESNKANYPKQIIGECLYNRRRHNKKGNYGFLVDCNSKKYSKIIECIKKEIDQDDWISFGKAYACPRIFLFDENNKELYWMSWDDLFSEKPRYKKL